MSSLPIAVLISGGGTTLHNLIMLRDAGKLDVDFKLVISSKPDAGGIDFAIQAGIPVEVVKKKKDETAHEHSERLFELVRQSGAKLVVMGGYLQHVLIPKDFCRKVINIHPSLIPSFCGKGMYGLKVHEAALEFGVKVSGCTVHFVDDHYDHGPIILQKACDVAEGDTPELLQRRVFELECQALPEAIQLIKEAILNDSN